MATSLKYGALAALLVAAPAMGCFIENVDFPGHDVDRLLGKVFSPGECQRQCQGNENCIFWTYQPSDNSCYMKSGEATPTSAEGLVSGPRFCPGPVDCSQEGIDLFGGDIIDTQVENPLACQFQCNAVNGCVFWTFLPSTSRCFLKGSKVEAMPHGEAISGPKECPTNVPIKCEWATDFMGHDIRSFQGTVADVQTCQQLCQGFNNCFYWTFVESTSSCYLKDATAEDGREYNPLTFSGARYCDIASSPMTPLPAKSTPSTQDEIDIPAATCFLHDYDYPGSDLTAFGLGSVTKPEACQLFCQYTRECAYFTFFDGTCYFKSEAAPEAVVPKPGAVSGPKYCETQTPPPTTTTTTTPPTTTTEMTSTTTTTADLTTTQAPDNATTTAPGVDKLLRFLRAPAHGQQ